jgi:thiol-disulfide isomerase/thioredoxin
MIDKEPETPRSSILRPILLAAVLGVVAGLAGVYGIAGLKRNATLTEPDPACRETVNAAKRLMPLVHGEVAAFTLTETPRRLPELNFNDDVGKQVQLAEFRGRTVLINLWATWCIPCRKEMPTLDRLSGAMSRNQFVVVSINLDAHDTNKSRKFFSEIGVQNLTYYEDANNKVFQQLKRVGRAIGLPTSILVDSNGCELGYLAGPADWSSDEAIKLLKAASAN